MSKTHILSVNLLISFFLSIYSMARFLFCLQIKRDLATSTLQCNDNTAALMASYIVQGLHTNYNKYSYKNYLFSVIYLSFIFACR